MRDWIGNEFEIELAQRFVCVRNVFFWVYQGPMEERGRVIEDEGKYAAKQR